MILWVVVKHTQNNKNNNKYFHCFWFWFFMFLQFDFQLLLLLYANFTVEHFLPISCQFHIAPFVVVVVVVVVANLSSISIWMCIYFVVVVHVGRKRKRKICDMFVYISLYISLYVSVYISHSFVQLLPGLHCNFCLFNSIWKPGKGICKCFVAYFAALHFVGCFFLFSLFAFAFNESEMQMASCKWILPGLSDYIVFLIPQILFAIYSRCIGAGKQTFHRVVTGPRWQGEVGAVSIKREGETA